MISWVTEPWKSRGEVRLAVGDRGGLDGDHRGMGAGDALHITRPGLETGGPQNHPSSRTALIASALDLPEWSGTFSPGEIGEVDTLVCRSMGEVHHCKPFTIGCLSLTAIRRDEKVRLVDESAPNVKSVERP